MLTDDMCPLSLKFGFRTLIRPLGGGYARSFVDFLRGNLGESRDGRSVPK